MDSQALTPIYASLGKRFLALLVDSIILAIPFAFGTHVIPIVGGVIVLFFYGPILEASEVRATLGKHLMGIQVTDLEGRQISLQASIVRNVLKYISVPLLFIAFLFALFTQKKQALHDLLANTLVVNGRSDRPIADAWMDRVRELFKSSSEARKSPSSESLSRLERLHALREKGVLTEEEFQEEKRKILSSH